MTNQMQVFPKYPHILNKHKLGDGQLNSTLIWAVWLFSPKTCCPKTATCHQNLQILKAEQTGLSRTEVLYSIRVGLKATKI